jgi:hypothetical protein
MNSNHPVLALEVRVGALPITISGGGYTLLGVLFGSVSVWYARTDTSCSRTASAYACVSAIASRRGSRVDMNASLASNSPAWRGVAAERTVVLNPLQESGASGAVTRYTRFGRRGVDRSVPSLHELPRLQRVQRWIGCPGAVAVRLERRIPKEPTQVVSRHRLVMEQPEQQECERSGTIRTGPILRIVPIRERTAATPLSSDSRISCARPSLPQWRIATARRTLINPDCCRP